MRGMIGLAVACLAAGVAPLVSAPKAPRPATQPFPGWPESFEGRTLAPLPLSAREQRFADGFPGRLGRFTDGAREVILRWTDRPTRALHPAAECFRATGYAIRPLPAWTDADGRRWSCFEAVRGRRRIAVREMVRSAGGEHWGDVGAWYWSAVLGSTAGPWWAVTVAATAPR